MIWKSGGLHEHYRYGHRVSPPTPDPSHHVLIEESLRQEVRTVVNGSAPDRVSAPEDEASGGDRPTLHTRC
jgi:hypothetical protein